MTDSNHTVNSLRCLEASSSAFDFITSKVSCTFAFKLPWLRMVWGIKWRTANYMVRRAQMAARFSSFWLFRPTFYNVFVLFLPNLFATPSFVSLEQCQNKFDKRCRISAGLFPLWTRVTLGLDMCKVCTEAVHCVALWTRVTLGLDMCKVCTEAVHCVALWTRVTLGLDMCKVCTEAVHCVALWTRVTLGLDMCKVCTEAVHCVALWTRVTLGLDMCKVCTEAVHSVALWTRTLSLCSLKGQKNAKDCVILHMESWNTRACHTRESPKCTI